MLAPRGWDAARRVESRGREQASTSRNAVVLRLALAGNHCSVQQLCRQIVEGDALAVFEQR